MIIAHLSNVAIRAQAVHFINKGIFACSVLFVHTRPAISFTDKTKATRVEMRSTHTKLGSQNS